MSSIYRGVPVPSILFDSTGTKKTAAFASYINELNTSVQMIFTVHDINLMDCKKMFRKEQIWFVHKDERGVPGVLPAPELIRFLLDIKGNRKGVPAGDE